MNCVSPICCDIWYYVAPNNFSCLTIFCYKLCYFVLCASALGCAGWRSVMIFIADCLWTSRCLSLRIGMLETAWMLQVIMRLAGWTAVKQFNGAHDRWYVLWIYELNDNCWGRNLDIIGFFLYGSILLCDDDYETIPMLYNVLMWTMWTGKIPVIWIWILLLCDPRWCGIRHTSNILMLVTCWRLPYDVRTSPRTATTFVPGV
jgi:hypothetical protein